MEDSDKGIWTKMAKWSETRWSGLTELSREDNQVGMGGQAHKATGR